MLYSVVVKRGSAHGAIFGYFGVQIYVSRISSPPQHRARASQRGSALRGHGLSSFATIQQPPRRQPLHARIPCLLWVSLLATVFCTVATLNLPEPIILVCSMSHYLYCCCLRHRHAFAFCFLSARLLRFRLVLLPSLVSRAFQQWPGLRVGSLSAALFARYLALLQHASWLASQGAQLRAPQPPQLLMLRFLHLRHHFWHQTSRRPLSAGNHMTIFSLFGAAPRTARRDWPGSASWDYSGTSSSSRIRQICIRTRSYWSGPGGSANAASNCFHSQKTWGSSRIGMASHLCECGSAWPSSTSDWRLGCSPVPGKDKASICRALSHASTAKSIA